MVLTTGDLIVDYLQLFYRVLWGGPLLITLLVIGIYLTIALRGIQFRYLWYALKLVFTPEQDEESVGDITHFESLMTALAATIGIGNVAGVATAITVGGFGAIFWMWITALIGMAIKYSEAILAVKYRTLDDDGEVCGGPMYFIENGLGWKWLAGSFAFFGAIGAFGGGNMLQANSVADVLYGVFQIDPLYTGIVMAILCGLTLLGGIKSIGRVASYLVPFMALFYIGGSLYILGTHYDKIPMAFSMIIRGAFNGQAALGGFLGSTLIVALQVGFSRGMMTSEAGLGTASIAAAAAKTDVPGRQALVSMTGAFLATIVMCSATALVLAVTSVFGNVDANGNIINGASLTAMAFQSVFTWGGHFVAIGLILFAFTTLLGWAYYGEKCIEYLLGVRAIIPYRLLFIIVIVPGAILNLDLVWMLSDICNGMMAIPNLIGVCALSSVVIAETNSFIELIKEEEFNA